MERTIDGRIVGSFGDAAAFSFCQDKIITTGGEGGLLATDDEDLWERAWSYKDHGKTWRGGVRARPSAGLPLGARALRHELAHDGSAGRDRPGRSCASSRRGSRRAANCADTDRKRLSDPFRRSRIAEVPGTRPARVLSFLRVRRGLAAPQAVAGPATVSCRSDRRVGRQCFLGLLLGDLPRARLSRHRMGAQVALPVAQRTGRDEPRVPGPSDHDGTARTRGLQTRRGRPGRQATR